MKHNSHYTNVQQYVEAFVCLSLFNMLQYYSTQEQCSNNIIEKFLGDNLTKIDIAAKDDFDEDDFDEDDFDEDDFDEDDFDEDDFDEDDFDEDDFDEDDFVDEDFDNFDEDFDSFDDDEDE